ncbi:hypothetical protein SAMN02745172_03510 [Pseudoxanthobacter soli DSM 19599]|uniref:Uncharacterized protein n=1 Tax=Pseudoxanthobacter soli DSM 19599 TaxID=1123029 RepID=A0A1M7ZPI8_9HYPH|nr:hypothetical protein SAMN02745172_03510 [Pseudoxanthobacter soli DSM 19599]
MPIQRRMRSAGRNNPDEPRAFRAGLVCVRPYPIQARRSEGSGRSLKLLNREPFVVDRTV